MKKYLFALMTLLCTLFIFSSASAIELFDACPSCGNTEVDWFTLTSDGKDMHVQFCEVCYRMIGESETCEPIPGSATCTTPERCKVCGFALTTTLSPDPDAHTWEAPWYSWNVLGSNDDGGDDYACTAFRICKNYCGTSQSETVDASCAITTPSTCNKLGIATYTASFEASWAETQVMSQAVASYGEHNYTATPVASTCSTGGYTKYVCTVCGDTYHDNITNTIVHWYGLWNPRQEGLHSAECKRSGCKYVRTNECTLFEITIMDDGNETILSVCPVCGDYEETPFAVILEADIAEIDKDAIPRGELIVRGMDEPFGGVLYAFTAAYEYAGKIEPFNGIVSVTIPLDAEKFTEFKLVRVDVTPATETTQRTEVWTDISFAFEDSKLTFETDTAGLYLLVPQQ